MPGWRLLPSAVRYVCEKGVWCGKYVLFTWGDRRDGGRGVRVLAAGFLWMLRKTRERLSSMCMCVWPCQTAPT